jgi:hypothetical protein
VINRRGVAPHQDETKRERGGRERTIALPADDRVDYVNYAPLRFVGKLGIRATVKQYAVQVEPGPPHRVVARPRALDAYLIAHQAGDAI